MTRPPGDNAPISAGRKRVFDVANAERDAGDLERLIRVESAVTSAISNRTSAGRSSPCHLEHLVAEIGSDHLARRPRPPRREGQISRAGRAVEDSVALCARSSGPPPLQRRWIPAESTVFARRNGRNRAEHRANTRRLRAGVFVHGLFVRFSRGPGSKGLRAQEAMMTLSSPCHPERSEGSQCDAVNPILAS